MIIAEIWNRLYELFVSVIMIFGFWILICKLVKFYSKDEKIRGQSDWIITKYLFGKYMKVVSHLLSVVGAELGYVYADVYYPIIPMYDTGFYYYIPDRQKLTKRMDFLYKYFQSYYIDNGKDLNNGIYEVIIMMCNRKDKEMDDELLRDAITSELINAYSRVEELQNAPIPKMIYVEQIEISDSGKVRVLLAYNFSGINLISEMNIRREQTSKQKVEQSGNEIVYVNINVDEPKKILLGFDLDCLKSTNIKKPLYLPDDITAISVVGGSGSGKTTLVNNILFQMLSNRKYSLYVVNPKSGDDYKYLNEYSHYYDGCEAAVEGIKDYFKEFERYKNNGICDEKIHRLVIEEYPSLIAYLNSAKTKKEADYIKSLVAMLLMQGRSFNFGIILVCQRASAELFSGGSIDNLMYRIYLGNMSKTAKSVAGLVNEDIGDRIFDKGEGVIERDGFELSYIKVPLIQNQKEIETFVNDRLGA